jgi:hypothetical protein
MEIGLKLTTAIYSLPQVWVHTIADRGRGKKRTNLRWGIKNNPKKERRRRRRRRKRVLCLL